ncbi:defective in cullin neddylation protein [Striga asiatica]|uniref:Defective in cullin neddylation protein n=1 Tax=Striga asiatica TaxID=4170 RepID=A0A5A7R6G7_STRAF|nr:defective in cullin neddylation protein [Striga asiatica]
MATGRGRTIKILHHHRAAPHLAALCRRTHHHRHPFPAHFPTPCRFLCLSAPTSSEPASRATPLPPILTRCRFSSSAATKAVFSRPEGIEALCSDLEVDYNDIKILILAWKMDAQKQGYFTQDEWRRGLKALRVDNIKKLKKSLPELKKETLKISICLPFATVKRYVCTYCKSAFLSKCVCFDYFLIRLKCLDIESTFMLIDLVLGFQYPAQVDSFIQFLKIQSDYKVMNMDQWKNFLRFCEEISFPDLRNYDTCEAWTLLLDNFVDWLKKKAV